MKQKALYLLFGIVAIVVFLSLNVTILEEASSTMETSAMMNRSLIEKASIIDDSSDEPLVRTLEDGGSGEYPALPASIEEELPLGPFEEEGPLGPFEVDSSIPLTGIEESPVLVTGVEPTPPVETAPVATPIEPVSAPIDQEVTKQAPWFMSMWVAAPILLIVVVGLALKFQSGLVLAPDDFKVLSVGRRRDMLTALSKRRKTLTELSREGGISLPTAKEHLDKLARSGFVEKKDEGRKWKYYELTKKGKKVSGA